ncbi:MAG: hypothetical protein LBG44_06320 [Gemmatimonadota bacterium]|nr:hypothetical protein [Gemmatimonadota bacterium]
MRNSPVSTYERTLRFADELFQEFRLELGRAVAAGSDLPPRVRVVHDRPGHMSPEFRTLAIPAAATEGGASPTVLSGAIASYARRNPPSCLMLVLDIVATENSEPRALLVGEARDRAGTRLFIVQPFSVKDRRVVWGDPLDGGWRDPGEDEMIIDEAFG